MPVPIFPETPEFRYPRAGIDPITDSVTAFGVMSVSMERPMRHETICLFLDHAYRGVALTIVSGTYHADSALTITESMTCPMMHHGAVGAFAIASVRPDAVDLDPGDATRWDEIWEICDAHEVELMEWYVVGARVMYPRLMAGDLPRWPADR